MTSAFVISAKKDLFFILGVAHDDPFVVQIGSQKASFRGFTNFFYNWIATKKKKKKKVGAGLRAKVGAN